MIATVVNPGFFKRVRRPKRMSSKMLMSFQDDSSARFVENRAVVGPSTHRRAIPEFTPEGFILPIIPPPPHGGHGYIGWRPLRASSRTFVSMRPTSLGRPESSVVVV